MPQIFLNIGLEAAVVGIVCIVFLILFVVAAIVQIKKEKNKRL
ncbi:Uncharacterized protein AB751O23_AD_00160 [Chlamydiales bacterium SCGC AB-751-O23]|jgi:hypothetical protein|nr:Uncharacterized protein AB751O23_AD_00160 [Chlamydiales bacterium SCGC AB-751-O23]